MKNQKKQYTTGTSLVTSTALFVWSKHSKGNVMSLILCLGTFHILRHFWTQEFRKYATSGFDKAQHCTLFLELKGAMACSYSCLIYSYGVPSYAEYFFVLFPGWIAYIFNDFQDQELGAQV